MNVDRYVGVRAGAGTYLMPVYEKPSEVSAYQPPMPKPRGTPLKSQHGASRSEDYNDSGYGGSPAPGNFALLFA